jgi:subtilisin family serine protease
MTVRVGASPVTWASQMVGAPEAHRVTRGQGARVAIIDTGLSPHEDLRGVRIAAAESLVPGETVQDQHGHGTAILGIVAAQGQRLLGLAPEAEVVMLKALSGGGEGMWSWVAAAVDRAMDLQADVVVMALGGEDESAMVADGLGHLALSGAIAVSPAGNSGAGRLDFPASTGLPIVATAVDQGGQRPSWANWGPWPASPDVAAPGVQVPVLARGGGYEVMSGTSMATGMAGGCMALVYAAFPGLRTALAHALAQDPKGGEMPAAVAEARRRLAATSEPLEIQRDLAGYGLINAARLLSLQARTRAVADSLGVPLAIAAVALFLPLVLGRRAPR